MGQVAPPSAWVCPPEPGVLSASYSWGESSPAAAVEMAGEGHRWSRFQRGSVSPDAPQTPSKAKKCTVVMQRKPTLYIKAGNLGRGKKGRVLSSKQNSTSNKQGSGDISRPKEQSYLRIKDFSFSSRKEVSGEERMLGRWKRADIPRWICRDQIFVAFKRNLKKEVEGDWRLEQTLKISAILRCCGREQWFSIDRTTGMLELTNADLLIASTTSWGSRERFSLLWEHCSTN